MKLLFIILITISFFILNSFTAYSQDNGLKEIIKIQQDKISLIEDNLKSLIGKIESKIRDKSNNSFTNNKLEKIESQLDKLSIQLKNLTDFSYELEFKINRIAPNPFNPSTLITYQIPENGEIKIEVLNVAGQKIENIYSGYKKAGKHEVKWYSKNLSSGFYLVKIHLNERISKTEKVMLLK